MRMRSVSSVFLVVLALAACHTITEEMPQQEAPLTPQTMPPVQTPVIVIPVPSATPPPAPSNPAPSNPANPAPNNPPPANPPQTQGCPLPAGTWNENCSMQSQSFLGRVEAAIDEVIASDPQAFDTSRTRGCANCYFVRDPTRYVTRVAQAITRNGICGHYDGEELAVKSSNAFNDQYDILTSDMFIRRQGGSYRSTCRPAWF